MMRSLTFCHSAEEASSFCEDVMLSGKMGCAAPDFVSEAKVLGKNFQMGLK